MTKRTSLKDAQNVVDAGDLNDTVSDKRSQWRVSAATE